MEYLRRLKTRLMPEKDPFRYLIIFCVVFYIALCLLHFISGRDLWLDERSVKANIEILTPVQLFGPLKMSQAFPRVYLYAVYNITRTFSYNVYAMRSLSFVFMLAAFFIWLRIFRKEGGRGLPYLAFILSWCGSHFMTYYSAELKQFSGDVFVAAVFAFFLIKQREYLQVRKIDLRLGLGYFALPAIILMSYTGCFFVFLPLYNLLMSIKENRKNIFYSGIYLVSTVLFLLLLYYIDARYTKTAEEMPYYWNDYFILTESVPLFFQTITEGLRNIFARWFLEISLVRRIMTVFLPFALYYLIVNGWRRFRQDKGRLLTLNTIIPAVLFAMGIAGALKVYPFTGTRVTLFIAPFIFYSIIQGIELPRKRLPWLSTALMTFYILTLCGTSIYLFRRYLLLYFL